SATPTGSISSETIELRFGIPARHTWIFKCYRGCYRKTLCGTMKPGCGERNEKKKEEVFGTLDRLPQPAEPAEEAAGADQQGPPGQAAADLAAQKGAAAHEARHAERQEGQRRTEGQRAQRRAAKAGAVPTQPEGQQQHAQRRRDGE